MILICSGSYVDQDLAFEVGRLPPSFLPVGNKRLFEHQAKFFSGIEEAIYISLPQSFTPPKFDLQLFEKLGIKVIYVPDDLSLGNSILFCWATIGIQIDSLTILHGDTLFDGICMLGSNYLSVHQNSGSYCRARVEVDSSLLNQYISDFVDDSQLVLSGLFKFSFPQFLMQAILHERGDFVKAIDCYSKRFPLAHKTNGLWLDFGHLNSFFKSRSLLTTQRSFNDLVIGPRAVRKSSIDQRKMLGEASWFKCLPLNLKLHTPTLLEDFSIVDDIGSYSIEYLYLLPLSDLYVFGRLPDAFWKFILELSYSILMQFSTFNSGMLDFDSLNDIYVKKTFDRLNQVVESDFWRSVIDKGLIGNSDIFSMVDVVASYISPVVAGNVGVVHGDFCFSNILFDSRTEALRLIDPRGIDQHGNFTIYGDIRYDVAKLYHSAVSCYDFIICGRYEIIGNRISFYDIDRIVSIEKIFDVVFFESGIFIKEEILAINVLLFISMLPLHSDRPDRQLAMLFNAFRLYEKLFDLKK